MKILLRCIETGPRAQEGDEELLKHGGEQIRCQSEVGLAERDCVSRPTQFGVHHYRQSRDDDDQAVRKVDTNKIRRSQEKRALPR